MDPFTQVYDDALQQLQRTQQLLDKYQNQPTNHHLADLNNSTQELTETIHDLSQSIGAIQSTPNQFGISEHEVNDRIRKVGELNRKLADIQDSVTKSRQSVHPNIETWNNDSSADIPGDSNQQPDSNLLYQDMIQEQDHVLDSVYTTVNTLREQANVMSRELEDQSYMIEDFERQADTAGDKLRRGIKRVNWVVDNNRETLSSCCITVLIVALIILLILVLVL